ncbi:ABC transporter ATP-binding protein [Halostella sp. JP-L12]|uniref:ABC transporter ATP-binding protein n=1 Tax=Halostella TaxID=1843185 RepID=UPI000EF76EF5|nr:MULTISPECIES: ABC transporter ATP-binding protein [Halostella]NHN49357.1 ABC transporter ATP-binding protein [Halostella sp. JP-L12]
MAAIQIDNLRKVYRVAGNGEVAVDGIDMTIQDGEFVTIVGPSGCGKTTTLRCIAGLEEPTEGTITIGSEEVTKKPPQRRNLSMVFQDIALYPHMTTRDNIAYPMKLEDVPKDSQQEKIQKATETLQISELLDKMPSELSGGQAQRVSLARAIVRDPAAFLLDEPMSDLDAKLKMEMRKEFGKIHRELDATMVYVTHDQEEAMTLSDKLAVMNDGRVEQFGSPDHIYQNPANVFVAQFIGSPSINLLDVTLDSVTSKEVTVKLETGERISFPFDPDFSAEPDDLPQNLVLGFRPRHTRVFAPEDADTGIQAKTVLNEPIGDEVIQYLEGPQGELRAVIPRNEIIDEDEETLVQVQTSGTFLFDRESGERVIRGREETQPVLIS